MPRADQRDTDIRHSIEAIGTELAIMEDAQAFAGIRVRQAITRTGLNSLLDPALDEIQQIERSVCAARNHVAVALARLMERADVN